MSARHVYLRLGAAFVAVLLLFLAFWLWPDAPKLLRFLGKLGILLLVVGTAATLISLRVLGRPRTRNLGINLALAAAALAVCLGLAEAGTRYLFADITTTGGGSGFFSNRWRALEQPRTNRWGFREREVAPSPQSGVYRIAVIGDSITYGQGIGEDERMTNLLQARLNEVDPRFEVVNFGRPGAETRDHLAFLRDTVVGLHPDFVLLQWFVNDVEGDDKSLRPIPRRLAPSDVLHSILWRHSALYNVAQLAWINLQYSTGLVESYDLYMRKRFADPHTPDSQAAAKALAEFIELAQEHGIPMGIILFPRLVAHDSGEYPLSFLHDRVLKTCAAYEIPCLDLRDEILSVADRGLVMVNRFDNHPSAYANRLMADAVFATFAEVWGIDGRP